MTLSLIDHHVAMLRYLGIGERDYLRRPIRPNRRGRWEFELVLEGAIAWTGTDGRPAHPSQRHSGWLFHPERHHGWTGDGQPAQVAVFHFDWLPDGSEALVAEDGWARIDLDAADRRRARQWCIRAQDHLARPRASSTAHHLELLGALCSRFWRDRPDRGVPDQSGEERRRVDDALAWYRVHCHLAPTVAEVAAAVYCSPAHLRRLFHRHRGTSPHGALRELQLERACDLLARGDLPIKAVAGECGFRSQAVFTRVFSAAKGVSPGRYRPGGRIGTGR